VVAAGEFADHHPYSAREIEGLLARAAALEAVAVTTAKDWVRVPPALRDAVRVLRVSLAWEDAGAIEALLP
jgi:tetraacyldisaccharide 4'-kinase